MPSSAAGPRGRLRWPADLGRLRLRHPGLTLGPVGPNLLLPAIEPAQAWFLKTSACSPARMMNDGDKARKILDLFQRDLGVFATGMAAVIFRQWWSGQGPEAGPAGRDPPDAAGMGIAAGPFPVI